MCFYFIFKLLKALKIKDKSNPGGALHLHSSSCAHWPWPRSPCHNLGEPHSHCILGDCHLWSTPTTPTVGANLDPSLSPALDAPLWSQPFLLAAAAPESVPPHLSFPTSLSLWWLWLPVSFYLMAGMRHARVVLRCDRTWLYLDDQVEHPSDRATCNAYLFI